MYGLIVSLHFSHPNNAQNMQVQASLFPSFSLPATDHLLPLVKMTNVAEGPDENLGQSLLNVVSWAVSHEPGAALR